MPKPTVSKLKKKLDEIYSKYIRNKYADKDGYCTCVTCGVRKHWKEMQNGHYIPRTHNSTRWYDRNCHPQCVSCNVFMKGRMDEYALFLVWTYGQGILEELHKKKSEIFPIKTFWLEEQIQKYKEIIK